MNFLFVALKDLRILARDRAAVATLLLMPLMFIIVMSLALAPLFRSLGAGPDGGAVIRVPVVDEDNQRQSREVVELLRKVEGLTVEMENNTKRLTLEEAEERVRSGSRVAMVVIPQGFSKSLDQGEQTRVNFVLDPARADTASVVEGILRGALDEVATEAVLSRGVERVMKPIQEFLPQLPESLRDKYTLEGIKREVAVEALELRTNPLVTIERRDSKGRVREKRPGVYEQNVPGYSVMFAFFIVLFVANSVLSERRNGTFKRLGTIPIRRASILAGKLAANYLVVVLQVAVLFAVGHFAFGMSLGNSLAGMIILTLALAFSATGLGILVAAFVRTEAQVTGVGILLILTLAALGGSMVPLFVMPDFMQMAAKVTPHAWAVTGYQDLIVRAYGVDQVIPEVIVLILFAVVFFMAGILRFRFES